LPDVAPQLLGYGRQHLKTFFATIGLIWVMGSNVLKFFGAGSDTTRHSIGG
jgi:hypothetical protein